MEFFLQISDARVNTYQLPDSDPTSLYIGIVRYTD